jgi:outer membrane protein insertion porin family/translocation and assembly module TamA
MTVGRRFLFSIFAFVACGAMGCTSIPKGATAIDRVDIVGNANVDDDAIESKLATASTPKLFGVMRGVVYDYELYDPQTLAYDLARVERYYHARGYYDAHARAGRVMHASNRHVRVEIVVDEGIPVRVTDVRFHVGGALDAKDTDAMERAARVVRPREPLDEDQLADAEKKTKRALEDRGYAKAHVASRAEVDLASHAAVVTFDVTPAERCVIGATRIEGLGALPEHAVRRALELDRGMRYSRTQLDDAERRLLDFGVVSSVHIEPDIENAPHGIAPLVVRLQPAKVHELQLGGGFELDVLDTDAHLRAGYRDRNFFGDLRSLAITFTPGVVLYPTRLSYFQPPTSLLPEEKFAIEVRQPGFIERRTQGFVKPELNVYPVIVRETYIQGEPVIGYIENKETEGVSRRWDKLSATLSHSLQIEVPFSYSGALDPSLTTLVISYVELQTTLDLRNDAIHPRRGIYLSNDLQLAGLGGQPQDIRVQPEVRGYVSLGKRVTIAARASVGFLFPNNYAVGTDTRDVQIVFFRGFFSGGPTENRGYPLRGIGPQGDVALYNPLVNKCTPEQTIDQCAVPLGGLSLWEANLEARVALAGPVSGVAFCDAADVSPSILSLRFDRPHLSCGLGARYDTPIGAIRADVGYRIPGLQVLSGTPEYVPDLISGVPIEIQIGLGEAF